MLLAAAGAGIPMICFVGFIIRSVYIVGMARSRSNYISANRTFYRVGFCCSRTIRCMCSLAAFDYNTTACNSTSVPMIVLVRLPFGAFGMSERITFGCMAYRAGFWSSTGSRSPVVIRQFTVLEGCRALCAANAGMVISSLCCAGSISRLVSIGCNFLVKHMGMDKLCFDYIIAFRTLNGVFLGSVTCMIRCMCCKIAFFGAACCPASVPVTACITCPAGSRIMRC